MPRRRCRLLLLRPSLLSLLLLLLAPARADTNTYSIGASSAGPAFDGLGASFTSATARLLLDYEPGNRSAVLDLLFAPSGPPSTAATFKGAALQILRIEIGGDANTGCGSEPAYAHGPGDAPNVARGWAGWLAQEAMARNPAIKILLTPAAWPGFLRGAGGAGATDPFADGGEAAAAWVATLVAQYAADLGVRVGFVGLWSSALADVAQLPALADYAAALRSELDARGLFTTRIVCSDSSVASWSCAAATDPANPAYSAKLAAAVGVLGDAGRPPAAWPAGAGGGTLPVWLTSFVSSAGPVPLIESGALAVANEWMQVFVNASVPRLGGFVFRFGISAAPYSFPWWHTGLVSAMHPWGSSWDASVALYVIGHVTQFVPTDGDWRMLPVGAGSGALAQGGWFVSFFSPSALQFTTVIFKGCDVFAKDPNLVLDENATFVLDATLAAAAPSAAVWRSRFPFQRSLNDPRAWTAFHQEPPVSLQPDGSFSLSLTFGDLITVSTLGSPYSPFKGCKSNDCAAEPPPPRAQGALTLSFATPDGVPTAAPGAFMTDISGAFEISADPLGGAATVLTQKAGPGAPIGPYADYRPHTLTGDIDVTDCDVAVDALLAASGSAALLGARVYTFHASDPATLSASPGVWLRISRADAAPALEWALLGALDAASYAAPVASGSMPLGAPAAGWLTLRLVVRGGRATASVAPRAGGGAVLLFSADVSAWAPRAGFVGFGTGSFTPGEASFRNLAIAAAATTCDALPLEGTPVEVEVCQDGSAGQMFELVLPPTTAATDFSASLLPGYDAPDLDCGKFPVTGVQADLIRACADNYTAYLNGTAPPEATCACAAVNSNGYGKSGTGDLEVYGYGSVDLLVLQPPLGQLRLVANASLCLSDSGPDSDTLVLVACADNSAGPGAIDPRQLFAFSRSIVSGSTLSGALFVERSWPGPSPAPASASVVDVWDLSFDVDHVVRKGGWNAGSNQVFSFSWPAGAGLIRATHMEVCLGACAQL